MKKMLSLYLLSDETPLAKAFLAKGCYNLWECISYIHQLPYGRNTQRGDYRLVLTENQGTCSTKHALIAALAEEQDFPLSLVVGFFEMNSVNTPDVAHVLKQYALTAILEAHCYLKNNRTQQRFDITSYRKLLFPKPKQFINEEIIKPDDIKSYKVQLHRYQMKIWGVNNNLPYSFEELWKIREACIACPEHRQLDRKA